jgi:hypothetical protein
MLSAFDCADMQLLISKINSDINIVLNCSIKLIFIVGFSGIPANLKIAELYSHTK